MTGEYVVFGIAAILTLLLGSLRLIRGNGVEDYLVVFIALLVAGLVVNWVYQKKIRHDSGQH